MTNVRTYTDQQIIDRIKSLPNFKGFPKGRGIVGVFSNEDETDVYDDKFYVMDWDTGKCLSVMTGTTNAGAQYLLGGFKSYNKKGVFVLKRDFWHYDLWTYGLHKMKMPALIQYGPAIGYRDGDCDGKAEELGPELIEKGIGINFHTNTYSFKFINELWKLLKKIVSWKIGPWSAGCQVVNEQDKYFDQMNWFKKQKDSGKQKTVTYVLLNEWQP